MDTLVATTSLHAPTQHRSRFCRARKALACCGLGALFAAALTGCGSDPVEVKIETKDNPLSSNPLTYLIVTAKVDDVRIKGLTINRGNCKVLRYGENTHLKFGDQFKSLMWCDADQIKEAEIETDDGKYAFTF